MFKIVMKNMILCDRTQPNWQPHNCSASKRRKRREDISKVLIRFARICDDVHCLKAYSRESCMFLLLVILMRRISTAMMKMKGEMISPWGTPCLRKILSVMCPPIRIIASLSLKNSDIQRIMSWPKLKAFESGAFQIKMHMSSYVSVLLVPFRYTIQRGCVDLIVEGTGCYDGKQEGVS